MKIGNRDFEIGRHTYIMGILNVTPDSFSDGGKWNRLDAALSHTEEMIRDGADIIDIGGESTRPGYGDVLPDEEEIGRVAPVIEAVRERFDVPISVDTYKSKVAEEAVQAGACLVNDIWGCKYDDRMARVIARTGAACCLMHNRNEPVYENYLEDVKADLLRSVELARQAGVAEDKIILDPGMGFGKTYEHNLILMNRLEILNGLGYPVLLGTSRKSMIGLTLDLPATDRVEGTLVTTVMGVMKGCAFVRVHDVKENARAIRMTEAILQA
ncbi:MAG: dihydropteroate synthase [Lachnospiraceae bacterium]|nr:dihydropteroate synthase [Lachnospiraceae bacterium]